MTATQIVDMVLIYPAVRQLFKPVSDGGAGFQQSEIRSMANALIPAVLSEVNDAHNWPFGEGDTSTPAVEDQGEYTLKGASNDARSIINVRYGSDKRLLRKMSATAMDEKQSSRTISSVLYWYRSGTDNQGFPKITLVGAPSDSTSTIYYRYSKNNIKLSDIPADYHPTVVVSGVVDRLLNPRQFDGDLASMKAGYQDAGGGYDTARKDPELVARNNERFGLNGYS